MGRWAVFPAISAAVGNLGEFWGIEGRLGAWVSGVIGRVRRREGLAAEAALPLCGGNGSGLGRCAVIHLLEGWCAPVRGFESDEERARWLAES